MLEKDSLDYYLKEILNGAKARSVKKKLKFELSLEVLKYLYNRQSGKCAITGINMTSTILKGRVNSNLSIDRIDPSKGYSIDNVQLVCIIVNIMKSTLSMDELKYYCNLIIKNNE